ncbi:hypothetical protein SAMN05428949_2050 [Chitinophaga sp. YR627]|uniref:hypothetical protein n=1 Tax=Chitinophaga sp. YR627 TaxID=1881041 RepID=UPI0008EDD00B|nr:hypothetical protein [Chitinophaga sp. YR627]SFN23262.1 hypothetical protein SAMN05428949_2050 [Chitinophaga sp. YR627]
MSKYETLSAEDRQLIRKLSQFKYINALPAILIGAAFILTFGIIFFIGFDDILHEDSSTWLFFCAFISIGGGCCIWGMLKRRKVIRLFEEIIQRDEKVVLRGVLRSVEVVNSRLLRYHTSAGSREVYIPLALAEGFMAYSYERRLESIDTFVQQQVALHIVTIQPGIDVLLRADYENTTYRETVALITEEERQQFISRFWSDLSIVGIILGVVCVLFLIFSGGHAGVLLILGGIILLLVLLIAGFYVMPTMLALKKADAKKVIITEISETLVAWAQNGKSATRHSWYRLGSGQTRHHFDGFRTGDVIRIELIGKNWQRLLDIQKVK